MATLRATAAVFRSVITGCKTNGSTQVDLRSDSTGQANQPMRYSLRHRKVTRLAILRPATPRPTCSE